MIGKDRHLGGNACSWTGQPYLYFYNPLKWMINGDSSSRRVTAFANTIVVAVHFAKSPFQTEGETDETAAAAAATTEEVTTATASAARVRKKTEDGIPHAFTPK
jgi:hypothetical protein